MNTVIDLAERGWLPDWMIRYGIRRLCSGRLHELRAAGPDPAAALAEFMEVMGNAPIAPQPGKPNQQHYELPSEFFKQVLGPRLKYSGCYYPEADTTLAQAEDAMLALSCERAGLRDGMSVLDLGCGWGSLSFWIAEHYPNCRITAVSNSRLQKEHIESRARQLNLSALQVVTCDINDFQPAASFDCVMSIEMFEHLRNYWRLLQRISQWLRPGGVLFIHVFAHQDYAYEFLTAGADNWMGRHFFTAGIMPADNLLPSFQDHLTLQDRWRVQGDHYRRTAEHWLINMRQRRDSILPILEQHYGIEARRWYQRWRMFFLACSELFGYQQGSQWGVSHYRFATPAAAGSTPDASGQIVGQVAPTRQG